MNIYRIARGMVRDSPLRGKVHREGWWWQWSGSVPGWDQQYSPEGPFVSKQHACRHLWNTRRLHRVAQRTGSWPQMPKNAGWHPQWAGKTTAPSMKPLRGTRLFGHKLRNYVRENPS